MLTPAHFFTAYIISDLLVPDARAYLVQILIFSSIVDLDHILGILRYARLSKEERKTISIEQLVDWCRTVVQEPIGILVLLAVLLTFYLSGIRTPLIPLAAIGFVSHLIIDFLSVHTRPLDPIDRRIVILWLDTIKKRFIVESIYTIVTGTLFLLIFFH